MPEQITTKPFSSKRQARMAFARGLPFARRWANQTDFAALPERKDAGADVGAPLHGPGGLLSTPGLGAPRTRKGKRWGMRTKDKQIVGNLYRSDTGKFTAGGQPSDAPPSFGKAPKRPKTGRGRKAPAKPKQTPEQRAQSSAAKKQQNAADVAKRMAESDTGLSPSGSAALLAFASGTQPDPQIGAGLAKMGMAEQATDGSYRMTPGGHAAVSAMQAGDYQRAVDAISRGTDASGKRTQRAQERATRQQAAQSRREATQARREAVAARRAAKKPSGGGKTPDKPAQEVVAKPKPATRRASGAGAPSAGGTSGAPSTPKPKPATEKPTKAQQTTSNRNAVRDAMAQADQGLAPGGFDNLIALGGGKEPDIIGAKGLIDMGMAERGSDGTLRLTSAGRQTIAAADRGDAKAAIDVISRASEPVRTKAQTAEDRAMFANMGGGGSGGSGGSGGKAGGGKGGLWNKGPDGKRVPQAGVAVAKPGGGSKGDSKPKEEGPAATKRKPGESEAQYQNRMFDAEEEGHITTAQRQAALKREMTPRATTADPQKVTQLRNELDTSQRKVDSAAKKIRDAEQRLSDAQDEAGDRAAAAAKKRTNADNPHGLSGDGQGTGSTPTAQRIRAARADADAARAEMKRLQEEHKKIYTRYNDLEIAAHRQKSFIVYKDHTGTHRWLARTTTAYRDRDQEIISSAALDQDSQRMTATKQFGPLRYWHVGQPDPLDVSAPWGPGLDIGDCDYSTLIGRTRVESGTFRDSQIAQKIASQADCYELSPGFFHPLDQPDAGGVFHAIRTFERSIVPTAHGRASNLFTGLAVKEQRMDIGEMEKRFKTAIADLGLNAEQAQALGGALIQTEKDATAQGIAFKSDDGEPAYPDVVINGITYKAAPPPQMEAMAADIETPEEEMTEEVIEEPEMDQGDYIGDMGVEEFKAMMGELLAPIAKMQDMHKGMTDALGELKAMYGGVATKDAGTQAEIASLKARLAQIEGDQPATILPDEVAAALKSAGPATPAKPDDPSKQAALSDPARPFAWLAMQAVPELYNQNGANE